MKIEIQIENKAVEKDRKELLKLKQEYLEEMEAINPSRFYDKVIWGLSMSKVLALIDEKLTNLEG